MATTAEIQTGLTEAQRRLRRVDLNRFIETLREAARKYQFGLEADVQIEIYDRTDVYVPGRPYAVLMVDGFEVRR